MKKWLAIALLAFAAAFAYLAAGPFLAINSIRGAIEQNDTAALSQHVDFPTLRVNLRAQVDDYLVRKAGVDVQASPFGAIALRIAGAASGGIVDALATPAGIGFVLQGRSAWHRISGDGVSQADTYAHVPPEDLLAEAQYRYESPSRFTATVRNRDGAPVVFVLTRDGVRWRVTDVRLPLQALDPTLAPGQQG
ncbi:DUF2939 domain-containing protein [Lysobacter korlensis]|uniref:DUF2939 domain-containing protein n=1 Tax=Lysobacter korlensis TaxID=553636 RepID=A0ABV6RQL8_9GAMM